MVVTSVVLDALSFMLRNDAKRSHDDADLRKNAREEMRLLTTQITITNVNSMKTACDMRRR